MYKLMRRANSLFALSYGEIMKKVVEIEYDQMEEQKENEQTVKKVLQKCFATEELTNTKLYVNVIFTNLAGIQEINRTYRNLDKPTDVLSFPMFEPAEIEVLKQGENPVEEVLGDIIIATEKVEEQAKEYGHSFQRELAYLLAHGFYHLMGYDHIKEEDKKKMRPKEEYILEQLKITRE